MSDVTKAVCLLVLSNVFMTVAWYGHLRFRALPLALAVLGSWGIALFEYALQVPANRIGYRVLSAFQLKVIQEAITLVIFVAFSWLALGERPTWRHAVSFSLVFAAVLVGYAR